MEYFSEIELIEYEGVDGYNPLAFKYYNPDEIVLGRTMKDQLRFAMSFWHTLTYQGNDSCGLINMNRPWDRVVDPMERAKARIDAAFEFMRKLQIPFFCFQDRDLAPEGRDLIETNARLDQMVAIIKEQMKISGIKCLWGTSNIFAHPRFVHGAATSCNATVFAYAAAQIKKTMEITAELGGKNFVFWGGREGYDTLLNTDTTFETANLARMLKMMVEYKQKLNFTGELLIKTQAKEGNKHQYNYDAATVLAFLRKYQLESDFMLNIEASQASLAGHSFWHELNQCRINGVLGSVDANQGDTDQFPTNIYDTTLAMYEILLAGGFTIGGLNFDAKVRRASFEESDLFFAYIAGMDAFAKGLKVAAKLIEDGALQEFMETRYNSYEKGIGKQIISGETNFEELEAYAMQNGASPNDSGRQELLEMIVNQYILQTK